MAESFDGGSLLHSIAEKTLRAFLGSGALLSLPSPRAQHRIPYGKGEFHFGDLWLPDGPGPHPVVVFIHGGFWRSKYGLGHASFLCRALAGAGVAAWNIEYRRVGNPGGGWPGTFVDVARGVGYLRALAAKYPLALERVILMGHSAGGHLALWYGAAHWVPAGEPLHVEDPLPLRAIVALAAVTDLRRAWELALGAGAVEQLLAGTPDEYPERYSTAAPQARLPLGVQQILIHGTEDRTVPAEMSQRFYEFGQALDASITLLPLDAMGHFELIDPKSRAWPKVYDAIDAALST